MYTRSIPDTAALPLGCPRKASRDRRPGGRERHTTGRSMTVGRFYGSLWLPSLKVRTKSC